MGGSGIKEFTPTRVNDAMATIFHDVLQLLIDSIPMPRLLPARLSRLAGVLVLAGLATLAQAAELGEAVVRSYAGQPLVADIEITGIVDDAVAVQVRPANADVYRGANIRVHPVIASVFMSVMRRDGRQFLHLTSVKPAEGDHVHLFLELNDGGRRSVRGVTLWLAPDPSPAPPPAALAQAADEHEAPAAHAAAAPALAAPSATAGAHLAPAIAAGAVQTTALRARAPGACVSQFSAEQIKTCAALDYKNGVLSAQIVELEEKVKALQLAMDGRPAVAPPPIKAAAAAPIAPAATAKAKPKATPWLLIGGVSAGALALLAGAGYYFVRRKRQARGKAVAVADAAAPKLGLMARLKQRFARKPKTKSEPSADAPAH